jgi:hypothetical protein
LAAAEKATAMEGLAASFVPNKALRARSDKNSAHASLTAQAEAQSPLHRDNKTGPENSGGASISGPHTRSGQERAGSVEFVRGDATCVQTTRNDPASKSKSSARSFRAMHDCAVQPLPAHAEGFGLTKPPRNWPREWDAPFEQQLTKSPETENHLRDLLALNDDRTGGKHERKSLVK